MNKTYVAMIVILFAYCAMVECVQEKTVAAKKNTTQKCMDYLTNKNITQLERCEFFKCFEERFPCGNKFWVMNWGYKYCRRYADQDFTNKFTKEGKQMLDHVNKCLPKHFEKLYKSKRPVRCKKLMQEAFDIQGKCYSEVQKLFCKAFPDNKELFIKVLDQNDLMNMDSFGMIQRTADKCEPKIDFFSILG